MSKGIELTQSQIKAYENGATMFLFPMEISNFSKEMGCTLDDIEKVVINDNGLTYSIYFKTDDRQTSEMPIKKGDKDIFVQEEFEEEFSGHIVYKSNVYPDEDGLIYFKDEFDDFIPYEYLDYVWQKAKNMTKEQSRYFFSECIDVKVVRVQDIEWVMGYHFQRFYNRCMQERNINRTYEDNDYVFSVEFKRCQD